VPVSNPRCPLERLTPAEAAALRAKLKAHGLTATRKALGLDARTVLKAAAEVQVGRLTASLLRAELASQ
jgi:hypothetical protein